MKEPEEIHYFCVMIAWHPTDATIQGIWCGQNMTLKCSIREHALTWVEYTIAEEPTWYQSALAIMHLQRRTEDVAETWAQYTGPWPGKPL